VLVSILLLLCAPSSPLPTTIFCHAYDRYWWYKRITSGPESAELPSAARTLHGKTALATKAAPTGPKVAVLFGSQTGTAESYAKVFANEAVARNLNAHALDMDDFDEYRHCCIFYRHN
jgi:sulfite reductase alpha subunit-like flavoprotein